MAAIPTMRVRVKDTGHEVTINVDDFDPAVQDEVKEQRSPRDSASSDKPDAEESAGSGDVDLDALSGGKGRKGRK